MKSDNIKMVPFIVGVFITVQYLVLYINVWHTNVVCDNHSPSIGLVNFTLNITLFQKLLLTYQKTIYSDYVIENRTLAKHINALRWTAIECLILSLVIVIEKYDTLINSNTPKYEYKTVKDAVNRYKTKNENYNKTNKCDLLCKSLFRLRTQFVPIKHTLAYPSSMDVYLHDIKNNISTRELMKHEWARYNSFRYFPKGSVMSPLR